MEDGTGDLSYTSPSLPAVMGLRVFRKESSVSSEEGDKEARGQ